MFQNLSGKQIVLIIIVILVILYLIYYFTKSRSGAKVVGSTEKTGQSAVQGLENVGRNLFGTGINLGRFFQKGSENLGRDIYRGGENVYQGGENVYQSDENIGKYTVTGGEDVGRFYERGFENVGSGIGKDISGIFSDQRSAGAPYSPKHSPRHQVRKAPFTLYNFYSPMCGASMKFMPVWQEVAKRLKNINAIDIRTVDATKPQNETLTFYYNITSYPTIILVTPDRNIEYNGDYNAEDLYQFVIRIMNECMQ